MKYHRVLPFPSSIVHKKPFNTPTSSLPFPTPFLHHIFHTPSFPQFLTLFSTIRKPILSIILNLNLLHNSQPLLLHNYLLQAVKPTWLKRGPQLPVITFCTCGPLPSMTSDASPLRSSSDSSVLEP